MNSSGKAIAHREPVVDASLPALMTHTYRVRFKEFFTDGVQDRRILAAENILNRSYSGFIFE